MHGHMHKFACMELLKSMYSPSFAHAYKCMRAHARTQAYTHKQAFMRNILERTLYNHQESTHVTVKAHLWVCGHLGQLASLLPISHEHFRCLCVGPHWWPGWSWSISACQCPLASPSQAVVTMCDDAINTGINEWTTNVCATSMHVCTRTSMQGTSCVHTHVRFIRNTPKILKYVPMQAHKRGQRATWKHAFYDQSLSVLRATRATHDPCVLKRITKQRHTALPLLWGLGFRAVNTLPLQEHSGRRLPYRWTFGMRGAPGLQHRLTPAALSPSLFPSERRRILFKEASDAAFPAEESGGRPSNPAGTS